MRFNFRIFAFLPAILLVCQDISAAEAFDPLNEKPWSVSLGYYLQRWDSQLGGNNNDVVNPPVDLEEELGYDRDNNAAVFAGEWRFLPDHRVSLAYLDYGRNATTTINKDIEIEGNIYPAGGFRFRRG